MGRKIKGFGRCPVCNRNLRRSAKRCTECSRLFNVFKGKYPDKDDKFINKMIVNHYKSRKYGSYSGGSKPKFLKIEDNIG